MCGILCKICYSGDSEVVDVQLKKYLLKRGPDAEYSTVVSLKNETKVVFYNTRLWMQGPAPSLSDQIFENKNAILLHNGDVFDETWDNSRCDTSVILEQLTMNDTQCIESHIIQVIRSIKGPFSLILYDKKSKSIYFTRDRIGRNSLLFHRTDNNVIISSVLDRKYYCVEVPATHIFRLHISSQKIKTYLWDGSITERCCINEWMTRTEKQQSLSDYDLSFNFIPLMGLDEGDEVAEYIQNVADQYANRKLMIFYQLLKNPIIHNTVNTLIRLLDKSVRLRVQTQPHKCKGCLNFNLENEPCDHCTVGILFSGGLDCTILAALAHKNISLQHSIHLINVAFVRDDHEVYEVPDRLTSRQSYDELQELYPSRRWVFLDVDVEEWNLEKYKKTTVADLIHPRNTVLDVSLGTVLWFASRCARDVIPYTSPCRIVLLGSGADELFGGYTRHRNAFRRQGWSGLSNELQLDWSRISIRNLARDNRVICDSGRQPRMPYLDDEFTDFVLSLKPWLRCFPSEKLVPGLGDKLMLRLVAFRLGLIHVATFPKKAMQFGSRVANKKENGSDISELFK